MKTETRYIIHWTMLVILLTAGVGEADTWITLDPPGAIATEPWGVEGSHVVGGYADASLTHHGFIYDGTNYTTLDYPGATLTEARDKYGSLIVGGRVDASGEHGFIYNTETTDWTPLSYPGASYSFAIGIHDGYIVGEYITDHRHGFLYHDGTWTSLDYPGAWQTGLLGIDGTNIVGYYNFYSGLIHYGYEGSNWATLNFPGASRTTVTGIDGGNIVGSYVVYGDDHGFLYHGETWTTLDFPGAEVTCAYGIDGGNIVGRYRDTSGRYHGFLYMLNQMPVADAGPDQVVECMCQTLTGTQVTLDGSGSTGPDGDVFSYTWTGPFLESPVHEMNPTVTLDNGCIGDYVITLVVSDGQVNSDPDTVVITVEDTTPPEIYEVIASPDILWPPNHKMVEVIVDVDLWDNCDQEPFCIIFDVICNEPINGPGDGNTEPDWEYTDDPLIVLLRAERSGGGSGRIYTLSIACIDACGNMSVEYVDVTVPHDKGNGKGKK